MAANRRAPVSPVRPSIRLSPVHSRDNSRSTSPERNRASLYPKIDPLLSNLSPESTLQALTSTDAVPTDGNFSHDLLSQSISQASTTERAVGIRAAVAARNLDEWYKEVKTWKWPRSIEAQAGKGFVPPQASSLGEHPAKSNSLSTPNGSVNYLGSLPAEVVQEYENRIEEIRDGIDDLDVEELKEHALNAHIPSRSRPSSSTSATSVPPPLSYVQLKDFTAVVTATILRALPCLSRLLNLLGNWDVRLLVLRQIPGLLSELKCTRSILNTSHKALLSTKHINDAGARLPSSSIREEHVKLEAHVISAGRRVDRILDSLEGREDSLPERWIDDLEELEADFAAWVVESDRYQVHTEWLRSKKLPKVIESEEPEPEPQTENRDKECTAGPDPTPVKTESASTPPMETIEEESRPASKLEITERTLAREVPDIQVSAEPTQSDSILPTIEATDDTPSFPLAPGPVASDEIKEATEVQTNITVAEDVQTPVQAEFPRALVDVPEIPSPTRVPLPATPDVENKENIPPQGFVPQRSSSTRESSAKPAVLAEHVDDDPFTQNVMAREPEQKEESRTASPVPVAHEVQPATSGHRDEVVVHPKTKASTKAQIANMDGPSESDSDQPLPVQPASHDAACKAQEQPLKAPIDKAPSPVSTGDAGQIPHDIKPNRSSQEASNPKSISPEPTQAAPKPAPASDQTPAKEECSKKKPLQSPIKLSKTRPGKLSFDKSKSMPRARRPSTGSVGSLLSDDSLLSSPDLPEPQTGSSSEDHLSHQREGTKTPVPRGGHRLREDRLRRLQESKIPTRSPEFQPNRSVSLPMQRFINEKMDLDLTSEPVPEIPERFKSLQHSTLAKASDISTIPTPQNPRIPKRRPTLTRGKSASDLKKSDTISNPPDRSLPAFGGNTARRALQHQDQPKSLRLRHRLTAHPSLEGLGLRRQELEYVEEDESELMDSGSRSSSPNKLSRKPRDHLDEKINTILSTLPGRIHLVDPNNEADTSSSSSSMDRRMRERFLSESPHGPPSRSITPAPSLTLMPAARRRVSHAHKTEDSYVKLYHLHHGGQTAPTKLFVRTVGEDGQRVMVRVGGGWADLGEYLREYVIHHGRRKVSETPRVEVQGLASRSPSGHSPGSLRTPAVPYLTSGRATPSRPPSVLSARPPSSLTVRKTRRGSTASEAVTSRSVTTGTLSSFTSPPSAGGSGRRLSISSSYSFATDVFSPPLPSLPLENSAPLGLAGPKPRSRQISMSPEGEAWVENVLQKTRRSTSFNPPPFGLNSSPKAHDSEHLDADDDAASTITSVSRSLPKVRSVNDIRSAGSSRRVSLRGLGNHR